MGSKIVKCFFFTVRKWGRTIHLRLFLTFKILTLSLLIDLMVAEKKVTPKFKLRFVKCKKYVVLCKRFTREV